MIDYLSGKDGTDRCTQTVCHQHKQSLCRSSHLRFALLVDEQTTRHIEEIESHTVNQTRENEEGNARERRIAHSEEAETEHPCKHGDEHHDLDAITLEEVWNQEDAERLSNLRDGYQKRSIIGSKGINMAGSPLKLVMNGVA